MDLRLGRQRFGDRSTLVMAIVNRTPDSFYDHGKTWNRSAAMDRVRQVVDDGADIVDIGGVKAGKGTRVDAAEEIRRTAGFVEWVRGEFPDLVISVDTWRAEVARRACLAGADLLNDAWGGWDPDLAAVAAEHGVGLVCTHTGGLAPRSLPRPIEYGDVVHDAIQATTGLVERAISLGVQPDQVLIDPAHDFGKSTHHSLEITRRLSEMTAGRWPVLVSLSHKDFIGETLDLPIGQRLNGTLAATALCAWHGARVFRVHDVTPTRQVLDMVASIQGHRPPARPVRGLTPLASATP